MTTQDQALEVAIARAREKTSITHHRHSIWRTRDGEYRVRPMGEKVSPLWSFVRHVPSDQELGLGRQHMTKALDKQKPAVIGRSKTADDREICLWSDGSLTWGRLGFTIKGSPHARTTEQIAKARDAGWLVLGDVALYDKDEVPRLIAAARKIADRGGSGQPGAMRSEFARSATRDKRIKPVWTVVQTDRDGKPIVRQWKLPKLVYGPGLAIWDERRDAGARGRYQVMSEIGHNTGTYAPTGVQFDQLDKLTEYLDEQRLAQLALARRQR